MNAIPIQIPIEYEATPLRDRRWAVRPRGALGTCGWTHGTYWSVIYVTAPSAFDALKQAQRKRLRGKLTAIAVAINAGNA